MLSVKESVFSSPPGYQIDFETLQRFEDGLNFEQPEKSALPCHVLGYGEISTTFEIEHPDFQGLAVKRMSVFEDPGELTDYIETYTNYNLILEDQIGVRAPKNGYSVVSGKNNRPIFYILQEKAPRYSIGNQVVHYLNEKSILLLVHKTLYEFLRVYRYSRDDKLLDIGIDGQISNWILKGFDPEKPQVNKNMHLELLDTNTPFLRIEGVEQLNAEIFLRPAPSFLSWILRLFYLKDVVNRYYDFRSVIVDLVANFYKEEKADLIPAIIEETNDFLRYEACEFDIEPIAEKEIRSYYRQDAFIWRLYLGMRRTDQRLHKITGKNYPYILPGKINR